PRLLRCEAPTGCVHRSPRRVVAGRRAADLSRLWSTTARSTSTGCSAPINPLRSLHDRVDPPLPAGPPPEVLGPPGSHYSQTRVAVEQFPQGLLSVTVEQPPGPDRFRLPFFERHVPSPATLDNPRQPAGHSLDLPQWDVQAGAG